MSKFRALALTGALFLVSAAAPPDTDVRPAKFDYTMTTLQNGLQVVFLEDHSTPIVHLALWYHVGSKDEKPGRTGFAHLFEHLMFKGSRNVRPDQHPSWITSVGGQANAFTDEDATVYWQTVPAQYLPLVLWLEADRMASLDVSDAKFKTEREVVKEERRMRYENQPFGRLPEIIFDKAFKTHPYKHQTIGSLAGPRSRVDQRRPRVPQHVLRAEQRHARARRRLRHARRAQRTSSSTSARCRAASRCRATSRRSRRTPPRSGSP